MSSLHVKKGHRYAAGVAVPIWLPNTVIGTQLGKADAWGWTNALVYEKGQSPIEEPGDHTHVVIATRSGPDAVVNLDSPPYTPYVKWAKEAYPDMVYPGDDRGPPIAEGPEDSGAIDPTAAAITAGVVGLLILGIAYLAI